MKKFLSLVLISFMLISTTTTVLSYQSKHILNFSVNGIEASVCPKGSVQTTLTITADPSNTETCNITLTPDKEWIILEVSHFTLSPGATRQVGVTLVAGEKLPGTYQGSILMTSNCKPQSVEIPVILHVLEPKFSVTPESVDVKQASYDEKTVNFYIQNGQCAVDLKVSSSNEFKEGNLLGATFQKSISLSPYQKITFPVKVKTNGLVNKATIQMFFDSPYVNTSEVNPTHTVTTTIDIIPLIVVEGEIVEISEDENYLIIETIDGKRYKVILREEDRGKYKKGEYIKVTGTIGEAEDEIIPEEIEKLECGISISDPEKVIFCPTCSEIKYGSEEILKNGNVKIIKIKVKNVGKIAVSTSCKANLVKKDADDGLEVKVELKPSSFSLNPGDEQEVKIITELKLTSFEVFKGNFEYELNFSLAPSPPCEKQLTKFFHVKVCSNFRKVEGTVEFINKNGNKCPLKGITVLLLANYKPKCPVRYENGSFVHYFGEELEGDFPDVHLSFNTGLPNKKYYWETYTDKDGKYSFSFFDPDCKFDYILAVLFRTFPLKEFKVTYNDCKNIFFVKVPVKDSTKPCPVNFKMRNIIIGKDTDLTIPSDFKTGNARDMAQIFCHMDEAFSVFREEKCGDEKMIKDSMLPLTVCAFSNDNSGTWYESRKIKINIDKSDSPISSSNRPINREWHEFGHFLNDSLYGIPRRAAGDRNHFGLANSNSTDSFLEGFAEATSLFILRQVKLKKTCCLNAVALRNSIYGWVGGMADLENGKFKSDTASFGYFDARGFHRVNRNNIRCVGGKLKDATGQHDVIMYNSDEEFGVAGLLIDLLDSGSWYDEIRNNVILQGRDDDDFSFSNWRDFFCLLKKKKVQNVSELYDALREKFKNNQSALEKIDKIFVDHGFFQDKNLNGVKDAGEKIGVTYRCGTEYYHLVKNPSPPPSSIWRHIPLPKIEERKDFPLIPQANILVHLLDSKGNPLDSGILVVETLSFDGRVNFSYEREAKSNEPFYIFIVPNGGEILRIHMKGSKEAPLIITEDELWTSVMNNNEHIKEHTFRLTEEESSPEIELFAASLEFGSLLEGETKFLSVPFVNKGGGILSISTSTSNLWIEVVPKTFEGNAGSIKVIVNTEGLSGGIHEGQVLVSGNGGQRTINVALSVIPKVKKTVIELFIGNATAYINGDTYTLDSAPYIKPPGRTMVPLRFISEGLGATVDYAPKKGKVKEVYIFFKGKKITLYIGKNEALIDNKKVYLDAPPEIQPPGRTFVPIRFIAETFGADVGWDPILRKVTITLEED